MNIPGKLVTVATFVVFLGGAAALLQADNPKFVLPRETDRDLEAGFEAAHAELIRGYQDANRKVFKFDIDCDTNRDGVIGEDDNGWLESTPPGFVMEQGEVQRVRLRLSSYFPYFPGTAVARLEVCGINRDNQQGVFASLEEEMNATGRIIVWEDSSKKKKILDSANPSMRVVEWTILPGYIIPGRTGIPSALYVEAARPSGKYTGDVRLLATLAPAPPASEDIPKVKFRSTHDHILFTILPK